MSFHNGKPFINGLERAVSELNSIARSSQDEIESVAKSVEGLSGDTDSLPNLAATIVVSVEDEKVGCVLPRVQTLGAAAKSFFERLKEEHSFTGGYTIVKDYVRSAELHSREMFIPLTHAPGEAHADSGEALVMVAGVEQKAHYLTVDLPHSDDCFVAAFPAIPMDAIVVEVAWSWPHQWCGRR